MYIVLVTEFWHHGTDKIEYVTFFLQVNYLHTVSNIYWRRELWNIHDPRGNIPNWWGRVQGRPRQSLCKYIHQLNPCKNRLYRPCQAALTDRSTFTREKVWIKRNSIRTNVFKGFDQREMISSLGWTLCEKSSNISRMKLRYESWKRLLFSWLLFCRN